MYCIYYLIIIKKTNRELLLIFNLTQYCLVIHYLQNLYIFGNGFLILKTILLRKKLERLSLLVK